MQGLGLGFQAPKLHLDEIRQGLPHFQLRGKFEMYIQVSVIITFYIEKVKSLRVSQGFNHGVHGDVLQSPVLSDRRGFFVVFLLAGVSELHDGTFNKAVLTWLLFSARRVSTRSLTPNGFPTRTVILWKTTKYVKTKKLTLKDQNTSWSQTEVVSPCPCEECRAPCWAARRSNLT